MGFEGRVSRYMISNFKSDGSQLNAGTCIRLLSLTHKHTEISHLIILLISDKSVDLCGTKCFRYGVLCFKCWKY